MQENIQKKLGFALPIFKGRGIFQYSFGLLPMRKPVNVVFGMFLFFFVAFFLFSLFFFLVGVFFLMFEVIFVMRNVSF